uniref:Uncharacterized protein n=1 Tax=Bionectria ochroleuca TaxID=29856 RepID=A0A8H7N3A6_BIOOC
MAQMAPKSGARCADTTGTSPLLSLSSVEKSLSSCTSGTSDTADRNDLSQTLSSARPWAMLARRPTVQMTAASSWSSKSKRDFGSRWAARTNGRVVEAKDETDEGRKSEKVDERGL